jgi:hypothetical protein
MRPFFRSAPGLLVLAVALMGCNQSQNDFTDTKANQVVVQVNGIS